MKFSLGKNNTYIYPVRVENVTWKSILYHHKDLVMICETDDEVEADGIEVIALSPNEVQRLKEDYLSGYPKPEELPKEMHLPKDFE